MGTTEQALLKTTTLQTKKQSKRWLSHPLITQNMVVKGEPIPKYRWTKLLKTAALTCCFQAIQTQLDPQVGPRKSCSYPASSDFIEFGWPVGTQICYHFVLPNTYSLADLASKRWDSNQAVTTAGGGYNGGVNPASFSHGISPAPPIVDKMPMCQSVCRSSPTSPQNSLCYDGLNLYPVPTRIGPLLLWEKRFP